MVNKKFSAFRVFGVLSALALFSGCSDPESTRKSLGDFFTMYDAEESSIDRGAPLSHYIENNIPIEIAAVWNSDALTDEFWLGVQLAADEINAMPSDRFPEVKINQIDAAPFLASANYKQSYDGRYRNAAQVAASGIAEKILENHANVAVVGHAYADQTATNALLSYERAGILFLASTSTAERFSGMKAPLAFQLFPTITTISERAATFAKSAGVKRLIIIQQRSIYGSSEDPIPNFMKHLAKTGIDPIEIFSFQAKAGDNTATVARVTQELVKKLKPENLLSNSGLKQESAAEPGETGLFLLVEHELAILIFKQLEMLKMTPPMLAASRLDAYEKVEKDMYAGFTFIDIYAPDRSLIAKRFSESFKKRFPDYEVTNYAALGYDHLRFLYTAFLCAESTDPGSVALNIRYHMPTWYGATGPYNFNQSYRNLEHSTVIFRQFREGEDGKLKIVTLDK